MRYSLILLPTILSVFTSKVYGTPTPEATGGSDTETEVDVPTWNIEDASDGSIVQVNGTVEQLYAELADNHPELLATAFDLNALGTLPDDDNDDGYEEEDAASLSKRTDFGGSSYYCYAGNLRASRSRLKEGIKYLNAVSGKPTMGAGGCHRVSCSYNAGIRWCNQDFVRKTLNSFGSIADGAQFVLNTCPSGSKVGGLATHKSKWRVEAHKMDC
ncbi:hypothetical protein B0J13DRAFT_563852 [Dactylonectria estremocensis]|uniref:Uncharacterized protein n=1 Tax=Dactylonectria estremocensis TaxID=1079267 RepID=A0A9P9IR15_9HYPO|nr:hypothetical protein B0J13DRAFT_563852 [Dactylonectria estremocensis]